MPLQQIKLTIQKSSFTKISSKTKVVLLYFTFTISYFTLMLLNISHFAKMPSQQKAFPSFNHIQFAKMPLKMIVTAQRP